MGAIRLMWAVASVWDFFLVGCLETKLYLGYFFLTPGRNEGRKSFDSTSGGNYPPGWCQGCGRETAGSQLHLYPATTTAIECYSNFSTLLTV